VAAATTRVRLQNTADDVLHIQFKARAANTGRIFIGLSDVALAVNGWELSIPLVGRPNDPLELDFGKYKDGSVKLNLFYADSTVNGESLDWVAIVK
jgi:hypothetical protein